MIGKVVYDDGYLVTLIRPFKDQSFVRGQKIEMVDTGEKQDLVKMFDDVLTDELKTELVRKLDQGKKTGRPKKAATLSEVT